MRFISTSFMILTTCFAALAERADASGDSINYCHEHLASHALFDVMRALDGIPEAIRVHADGTFEYDPKKMSASRTDIEVKVSGGTYVFTVEPRMERETLHKSKNSIVTKTGKIYDLSPLRKYTVFTKGGKIFHIKLEEFAEEERTPSHRIEWTYSANNDRCMPESGRLVGHNLNNDQPQFDLSACLELARTPGFENATERDAATIAAIAKILDRNKISTYRASEFDRVFAFQAAAEARYPTLARQVWPNKDVMADFNLKLRGRHEDLLKGYPRTSPPIPHAVRNAWVLRRADLLLASCKSQPAVKDAFKELRKGDRSPAITSPATPEPRVRPGG